jgi:hypothetical protein
VGSDAPFAFVQFEFAFPLGPDDGRYLARGADREPRTVIVLKTLGAPQRRLMRGRRPAPVESAEAEPVPTVRVTLIRAAPFGSAGEAEDWLERVRREADASDEEVATAVAELNAVLRAHRAAMADPNAPAATATLATAIRVGYGSGDLVADGRFDAAYELPRERRRRRRREALAPQERLAAILAGDDTVLACEELVLRARADLDADRPREAALQCRIALEAAVEEGIDDGALGAARPPVAEAANAALSGDPPVELREAVAAAVTAMERLLRRRRAERVRDSG